LGFGNIDIRKFLKAVDARKIDAVYTIEAKDTRGIILGFLRLFLIGRL
jgi:hypothetical protein